MHLEFVSLEDQLYLVDHYMTYCQTAFRYQKTEAQDLATDPLKRKHTSEFLLTVALDLMGLVAQEWQLELAWAQRLREWIVSGMQHDDGTTEGAKKEKEGENQ